MVFPVIYRFFQVMIPTYTDGDPDDTRTRRKTRSAATSCAGRPTRLRAYLIGQPCSGGSAYTVGRATRGYVGLDVEDNRMVFIKDQWRPDHPGHHPEVETYERLRRNNIGCVATCLGGGDVICPSTGKVQSTIAQKNLLGGRDNPKRHHVRLILKEIGRPLDTYNGSPELIATTYHALLGAFFYDGARVEPTDKELAHCEAWEHAGVLHRDISIGNIMIDVESPPYEAMGFLTDWDLAKYKEDLESDAPSVPGARSVRHAHEFEFRNLWSNVEI